MAEGIQKRIEYADLQFISAFAMGKILDFQTWEIPGEHARGNFRLLLSENETGINGMNEMSPFSFVDMEIPQERCSADIRKRWKSKKKADTGLQMYRLYLEQFC